MSADLKQLSLWDDPPAEEDDSSTAEDASPATEDVSALQSALERRILQGLAAEWDNALWLLPESIRRFVKQPIFAIRDMPRKLGCWYPDRREIALNRDIVSSGRWDDVKEVLLHEMAHQVAHQGLQATSEPDHGQSFKRACRLLRANPAASGSYRPLNERLHHNEEVNAGDRILIRIQKLMALAESSNANEAQAAMRKAHELISRHNVELIEQGIEQEYTSIFLGTPRLRHFREAYHLAHLLQDFYFVKGMWIQAWVMEKARMGRVLEISGSPKNVQIAAYVHDAVIRYIDTAWAEYRRGKGLNRYRKTDFAVGIIEGFTETLQMATAMNNNTASHLPACVEDHALVRYVDRRYPHVRSFSKKGPGHDAVVLADGNEKGRKLVIAKGISHSDGYKERVLEYQK